MKKNTVLLAIISTYAVLLVFACSNLEQVEEKDDAGNVIAKYKRTKDTFAKEGLSILYSPDGKVQEEANYKDDVLHGTRKIYDEAGKLEIIEHYDEGKYSGKYELYYPNGQVKQVGGYENNEMVGLWKGFFEDGLLKEEVIFKENNENGPFKEYFPNGKIAVEGEYKDGPFETGVLKEYNENGALITRKMCLRGICKTIWNSKDGDIPFDEAAFKKMVENVKSLENQ